MNLIIGSCCTKIIVDQISNLSPSEKSVVLLSSLLFDTYFLPEVCAYRNTSSMLLPSSYPILHNLEHLFPWLILERWGRWLFWLLRFLWFTAQPDEDFSLLSTLLFGMLLSSIEIPYGQGIFQEASPMKDNSNCHATLSTSPNTRSMLICHRHRTISSVETGWSPLSWKQGICIACNGSPLSLFPNPSSRGCCQIPWIIV